MAISTMAALSAAANGQQEAEFSKNGATATSGGFHSLFFLTQAPLAGASVGNTTTGVIPTSATQGAFPFANPSSGNSYLLKMQAAAQQIQTVVLYDRLWHGGPYNFANGSISANTTTAVNRDSTGYGAELWVEIFTAMSAVACTLTVTYVNQNGTGSRTATCVVPASGIQNRLLPFVLQAGDTGIQQITNISGSAAPTGNFNLVILRKVAQVAVIGINQPFQVSWEDVFLPRIYDDACLCLYSQCGAGNTGLVSGALSIVQG